ncbi:MAG: hypothetical protein ACI81R_000489 [Bradymonadia bacterium]|jgi:hypothetical protein
MNKQAPQHAPKVRLARRIGMSLVSALILWTIVAVTVGVLQGLNEHSAPVALEE